MAGKPHRKQKRSVSLKGGKHARRSVSGRISLKHLKSSTSDTGSSDSGKSPKRHSLPVKLEHRKSTGGKRRRSRSSSTGNDGKGQEKRTTSKNKPGHLVSNTENVR